MNQQNILLFFILIIIYSLIIAEIWEDIKIVLIFQFYAQNGINYFKYDFMFALLNSTATFFFLLFFSI